MMEYNIKDFGAIPDGMTLNTSAIQHAIDTCAENGGDIACGVRRNFCMRYGYDYVYAA